MNHNQIAYLTTISSPETLPRSGRDNGTWKTRFRPIVNLLGALSLLFGIILLAGCSAASADTEPVDNTGPELAALESSAIAQAPSPTATPEPTATPVAAAETDNPAAAGEETAGASPAEGVAAAATETESEVVLEPEIGKVTFALDVTPAYEPVEAGLFFTKGITEVHALFNYSGMSPDYTWERVWYLNDKEVARISEPWNGPEAGVFDYFVNNQGRPLPAGDWVLELYVEDELQALGVFVIEEPGAAAGPYPLVYTKCDGDHHNIYVADTSGNNEQLIVTRAAGPSWTPGRGAIFFYGEAGIDRQIRDGLEYIFDGVSNGLVAVSAAPLPTTINQLNLFQSSEWKQGTARWANVSPDGSMVAFDARPSGDYRIYFLGTDTNQQFRYEILGEQADWSPDSQRVVYRSGRDGRTGLWISNREDNGHILLTNDGSDSFPAWSPDGQTIAFSRDAGGNTEIYTIGVDGSNLQRLTNTPGHDTLPTYAPNGDIIFRSTRTGSWAIWKMKGDGSEQTSIIANACVGNDWAYSRMDVAQ